MAIDPNIYALSIELSLNASDAFDTLNDFEESLLDIEEQIVDAAKSAIGKIDNLVSDADSSIRKLSASILDLSSNTVDIAKSVAGSGIDGIHTSIDMAVESADKLRGVLDSAGESSVSHFTQLNQELVGISDSVGNIKLSAFEDSIGLAERTVDIVDSISFENQLSQLSDAENVVDGIASKYRMITSSDFGPTVSYLDTMSSRLNDILLVIDKSSNSFRQLLSTMEDSNSRLSMIYVGQDASFSKPVPRNSTIIRVVWS